MLLDEDPASLIRECIGNFNIAPDRSVLSRIGSNLTTLSHHRASQLSAHESALKRSGRALHALEQQHSITLNAHNPTDHAEEILRLDSEKFKVAKGASDLEIEGERLEGELGGLKRQLAEAEGGKDVWDGRQQELGDVLKLKLYRSLGIDANIAADGSVDKAIVRKSQRPEVNIVEMDTQVPRQQYVNKIWEAL